MITKNSLVKKYILLSCIVLGLVTVVSCKQNPDLTLFLPETDDSHVQSPAPDGDSSGNVGNNTQGGTTQEPSNPSEDSESESGGETGSESGNNEDESEELPPPPENPDMYYIILDPNGGTGERLYEERGKNTVYYPAYTSFTKSGYAFLGWAERKTAEMVLYADGSPIPVTNNRILYAVWMPESEAYTVTFDLKGGADNGMPEKLSCRPGGSIRLPSLDNTYKAGYVRDGYSPDGTVASGLLKAETEFFPTADTTLCVVWGDGCYPQYSGQIKWVSGVSVQDADWGTRISEYGNRVAFWRSDAGWYDVYQGNGESSGYCWAAVASNMLLWWYDQNSESVKNYIASHPDTNFPAFIYDGKGSSEVFSYFTERWSDAGTQPTFGLNWFLTGNSDIRDGALFREIFSGKDVTYRSTTVNKATFNAVMTEAFENRKIIGIEIVSYGPHAITIWGAQYGDDGFIKGLYLTDSAVPNETLGAKIGGLQYSEIVYQGEKPYLYYNGGNLSAQVTTLYTFSSCEEIWKDSPYASSK